MSVITSTRRITFNEAIDEMDRRDAAIETLEAERDRYLEALRDIDAVGVDFGHFEAAARTMQEHAQKALAASSDPVDRPSLLKASRNLRRIVEEIDGTMKHGTWRDDYGMRLKDTPEWVAFYLASQA